MKNIIPFTKELEFNTKVSEIKSISLERDFKLENESIEGNLYITGEYKSHEVSVNVIPFSFKIPFTIEVPKNIKEDTLSLEISDFAYDTLEDNKIKVHVELELDFEEQEEEEPELLESPQEEMDRKEITDLFEEVENIKEIIAPQKEDEIKIPSEEETTSEEENIPLDKAIIEKEQVEEEYTNYHIHILKEGENLETICNMYNVTGSFLAEYNDINNLTVGEKILIPSEDE